MRCFENALGRSRLHGGAAVFASVSRVSAGPHVPSRHVVRAGLFGSLSGVEPTPPAAPPSLYLRLGGEAAIEAAVVSFYDRVMADEAVAHFFQHMDMPGQIRKQIAFMTMAFGGPSQYSGRDLRTAHAKLVKDGLSDAHFDRIATHLSDTLAELGVDDRTTAEVMGIVGSTRGDVLGR
jgi:hemoglobin